MVEANLDSLTYNSSLRKIIRNIAKLPTYRQQYAHSALISDITAAERRIQTSYADTLKKDDAEA